jgi:hypothetical protein
MTVKWLSYEFSVRRMDAGWNDIGGVYIFAALDVTSWYPTYVGVTDSFKVRLTAAHEKWTAACQLEATYVHAMAVLQEAEREAIAAELIGKFQPPLNTRYL